MLHVADWHVPLRSDPLLVKGDGLWAEHTCDAPMEQWTVTNETYAAALDDPDDALGRAYGVPTALSWDLEWYATCTGLQRHGRAVLRLSSRAGVVHGEIEIGGADPSTSSRRRHTAGTAGGSELAPVELPEAFAHTGLRAPFAFPDGSVTDWVLTPDGWRERTRRASDDGQNRTAA